MRLSDGATDAVWGCDEAVARNESLLGPALPQYRGLYFVAKSESLGLEAQLEEEESPEVPDMVRFKSFHDLKPDHMCRISVLLVPLRRVA